MFSFFRKKVTSNDKTIVLSGKAYNYLTQESDRTSAYLQLSELVLIIKEHNARKSKAMQVGDVAVELRDFLCADGKKTDGYSSEILNTAIIVKNTFLEKLRANSASVSLSVTAFNYLSNTEAVLNGPVRVTLALFELLTIIERHNERKETSSDHMSMTLREFLHADGKKTDSYSCEILNAPLTVSREFVIELQSKTAERTKVKAELKRLKKSNATSSVSESVIEINAEAFLVAPELSNSSTLNPYKTTMKANNEFAGDDDHDDHSVNSNITSGSQYSMITNSVADSLRSGGSSVSGMSGASMRKKKVIDTQAAEKAIIDGGAKLSKAISKVVSDYRKSVLDNFCSLLADPSRASTQREIIIKVIRELLHEALFGVDSLYTNAVIRISLQEFDRENEEFNAFENEIKIYCESAFTQNLSDSAKIFSEAEKIKCAVLLVTTFTEKPRYLLPLTFTSQLTTADQAFAQFLQNYSTYKLNQLMQTVLTPRCIAYIRVIGAALSDQSLSAAFCYKAICELLVETTCTYKKIDVILGEFAADSDRMRLFQNINAVDRLVDKPSLQDKKDFMLCFSYVINEYPDFLLTKHELSPKEIMKIASDHVAYSKKLRKFGDRITVVSVLPAFNEDEVESPLKNSLK